MIRAFLQCCLLGTACVAAAAEHPVTMWRVDGEHNRVYLLGSIHLLRAADHPLPTVFDAAYADAEVLLMELDMDDIDPLRVQAGFVERGLLPAGETLAGVLGDEAYSRARRAAEAADIPLHMLHRLEPWYAALTIEMLMLARLGFDGTRGVEMLMTGRAVRDNKPIEGLETVDEQLSFLDGLSPDAQVGMLFATLDETTYLAASMDELVAAWRHGDLEALKTGLLEDVSQYEEFYRALLVDRNRRWLHRIVELLDDEDDYLVVVGALHLIGGDGVPALLKERGRRVTQLSEGLPLR